MARSSRRARPTRRLARLLGLAAIPVAVVGTGALVMGSSYSVFSVTTSNPTNNWSTGTVSLSDDDSNTAMFNATNMAPGSANSSGSRCIVVTSSGNMPSTVELYGTSYNGGTLASSINLTIEQGTGGTFSAGSPCTGFTAFTTNGTVYNGTLAGFGTTATSWSTGLPTVANGAWQPTGAPPETRVYKFTYSLQNSAPQGGSASIGFTWEAQNR